jgi:nucleoside-triphosphatase
METPFLGRIGGFLTEEQREKKNRVGFEICTIPDGERGILAKKGLPSPFRVGAYGVCLESLEELACRSIEETLGMDKIIVIDEIGKMELFSVRFKKVLMESLSAPQPVLASILHKPNDFADKIKERADVQLLTLTRENYPLVYNEVKKWLVCSLEPVESF